MYLVLSLSNVMNSQGFRSGACGFRLNSLNNLVETKSEDGVSFLVYLARLVKQKFPGMLQMLDDLSVAGIASRISLEYLKQYCQSISSTCSQLVAEVEKDQQLTKRLPEQSVAFIKRTALKIKRAEERLDEAVAAFKSAVEYFGDELAETTSEEWFTDIHKFVLSFKSALKLVEECEMPFNSPKKPASIAGSTRSSSPVDSLHSNDQKGVMDNLLESLRKGTVPKLSKFK
jgi:cytokinesis protein